MLRALPGRLRAGRCLAPARASRRGRRCTRHVLVGTPVRPVVAGANALRLRARIGRRALAPGAYRVTVTVTDAAGHRSAARSVHFRVVSRRTR